MELQDQPIIHQAAECMVRLASWRRPSLVPERPTVMVRQAEVQDQEERLDESGITRMLKEISRQCRKLISAVMTLLHHFHFWVCSIVAAWQTLCHGLLSRMWHAERLCPSTRLT